MVTQKCCDSQTENSQKLYICLAPFYWVENVTCGPMGRLPILLISGAKVNRAPGISRLYIKAKLDYNERCSERLRSSADADWNHI